MLSPMSLAMQPLQTRTHIAVLPGSPRSELLYQSRTACASCLYVEMIKMSCKEEW